MLAACLASLGAQSLPPSVGVSVVVIDNEAQPNNSGIFLDWSRSVSGLAPVYIHEPRRGISQARNAALAKALELGANWIAFIDDDEIADPDWLQALWSAAQRQSADVVAGPVPQFSTEGLQIRGGAGRTEGARMKHCAAGNVLFRASLASEKGLRFDPRFDLTGGEDTDFFSRARRSGAVIVWTNAAVAREVTPPSRMTLKYHASVGFRRGLRVGVCPKVGRKLLQLVIGSLALPLSIVLGWVAFRHRLWRVAENMAFLAGVFMGLFGYRSEHYKRVHGY
jgi:succinoglycan biosynthesis protein ExoM